MTPQERLAALKNLESGLQTEIIRATASPDQGFYCVKLDKNADLDLVEEFRIYADLKWEVGYFFTAPSMNHYIGLNYVSQEAATNLRTRFLEWVKAEIAKMEQPAPAKPASALPYKVLLNSMDSRMGYDEQEKHHWLFVSTDANDSQMLFHDIGWELSESTGAVLRIVDMDSLYMLFNTKTKADSEAREIEAKVVEWLKKRIAEIEQPPFDPKEAIEAAAADQEGMDAAESLLDREQMRFEMGRKVHDFQSAVHHLYKALDAGYAKDDEIAALKKDLQDRIRQHVGLSHEYVELHAEHENLQAVSWAKEAVKDKKIEQLQADLQATNLSKDNKIAQLSHEVSSLNSVLTSLANELAAMKNAAEPKDAQPAPVRLPVAGDTIEFKTSRGEWIEAKPFRDQGNLVYRAGFMLLPVDEQTFHAGDWRWPEPRTRTAAQAKVGDAIWVMIDGKKESAQIAQIDYYSIWAKGFAFSRHATFGTQWGYAEEQLK